MARPKSITTPASHKRQLSEPDSSTPASRASKRLRELEERPKPSGKATPTKSKYFEGSDSDAEEEEAKSDSGYEDGEEDALPSDASPSPSETSEDYDSEEADRPSRNKTQKKRLPKQSKSSPSFGSISKELWRPGVKTGLGPGKQVFIEKPKARGDGGIKYAPGKIHPNTMAFLADLKKNNDREWFKMHEPDYRQAWADWTTFVEALTEKIMEVDETVPELPPKDLVFRIYRDIRFSSDPTPYKPHFSAAWSRTGRKGPYACYYVQIMPSGKSFVGSGLWMPEAQPLSLVRRDIDRKSHKIKAVLMDATVRKDILGGVPNDPKKVIKAFASHNSESALKTKPKGYEADNPNIELLRLRSFTMGSRLLDNDINDGNALDTITARIQAMLPFVTYLNGVVMPDDDDDDDDSDESESDNTEAGDQSSADS